MEFADVVVVVVLVGFVALCVAYVRWCDRLVGPDPVAAVAADRTDVQPVGIEEVG